MEIYAGMIDNLDYNIGRLIQYLKKKWVPCLFQFLNGSFQLKNPFPLIG